jgi:hypothetical protein
MTIRVRAGPVWAASPLGSGPRHFRLALAGSAGRGLNGGSKYFLRSCRKRPPSNVFNGVHELAISVKQVLDLPPKIGGNIVAGLLKPQLDHPSRVLSILRRSGWINGKCGQCLERIEGVPPGQRSEIFVVHRDDVPSEGPTVGP